MTQVTPRPKAKKRKKTKTKTLQQQCDDLFPVIVKSIGRCEADDGRECKGWLECAHGFPRGYRAVRWDHRNAWSLCCAHHKYYTHHPLEWTDWMRARMGEDLYEEVRVLALAGVLPDLPALVLELKDLARQVA